MDVWGEANSRTIMCAAALDLSLSTGINPPRYGIDDG